MKKLYLYLIGALILIFVLYNIWPLPFEYFAKSVILPASNILVETGKRIVSPISLLKDIGSLNSKNKELENNNRELTAKVARLKNSSRQCIELMREVDKSEALGEVIIAKVVSRTPGGLSQKIIINRGEEDSVKSGSAVLANGYFVGRVGKVEKNRSEVELIFSHGLLVPVMMEKNPEGGLLQGGLEGLTVTDIPINSKIEAGDKVMTSGLGGELPSGLLIGGVALNLGIEGELFQRVRVKSPINPYLIDFVSVLNHEL
ncbi:MAG: rod shape-determining protein MreC [bacterium]